MAAKSKYIYGAVAEKLPLKEYEKPYDIYEINSLLKEKKNEKVIARTRLKIIACILAAFAACWFIMYRYAMITELNYALGDAGRQYNELLDSNARLRVDIEKQLDLQKIREIAEKKYGMHKPDIYQTFYVKIDKNDHVLVSEEYRSRNTAEPGPLVFRSLANKIAGLLH